MLALRPNRATINTHEIQDNLMTNETSYREKGRALFLAALMVLSVVAMSAAFAGGAAAASNADDSTDWDSWDSDTDFWQGQSINVTNIESASGADNPEAVRVYEGTASDDDAERITTLRVTGDSVTLEDTDDFDGAYHLEVEGDTTNQSNTMWWSVQDVEVEFDAETVQDDSSADLEITENNREEAVTIALSGEYEGEALDEDDLEEIFNNTADFDLYDDDDELVTVSNVADDGSIDADFDGQDLGDYNFTASVYDTTAEDTAEITVEEATDAEVNFDASTYEGITGDEVEMGLDLVSTDDAYFNVTHDGETLGQIEVEGIDDDADSVNLVFNTYNEDVKLVDDDGDEVDSDTAEAVNFDLSDPLPALDYEIEAFASDDYDDETDAALLILNDRSTDDITTHVAPSDLSIDDDAEDFLADATERNYVADEDYLITQVEASGLYGYLDEDHELTGDEGLNLTYEQQNVGPFDDEAEFNLSDVSDYQMHVDADNQTFYVIFNVDDTDMDADEEWNAEFHISDENDFVDDDESESVDTDVSVEEADLELTGDVDDDDRLLVSNSATSELTAETNLAPGTEAEYRVRFATDVHEAPASVDENGVISAEFDFSDREAGDEIRTVRVDAADERHEVEGVVYDAGEEPEEEAEGLDWNVDVDPAEPVEGDDVDVTVSAENVGEETESAAYEFYIGEDVVLGDDIELEGGEDDSWTHTVEDAEAGDYEWELKVDGDVESDGTLTVAEDEPADDDATDDDAADDDAADDGAVDDDAEPADDGEEDGTPGFGVAVAVVALLAAAMLALRRQN